LSCGEQGSVAAVVVTDNLANVVALGHVLEPLAEPRRPRLGAEELDMQEVVYPAPATHDQNAATITTNVEGEDELAHDLRVPVEKFCPLLARDWSGGDAGHVRPCTDSETLHDPATEVHCLAFGAHVLD
jgi:hypothetical protein